MKPEIADIEEIQLVGIHIRTSQSENKTLDLWREFVSRTKEIKHSTGNGYYSVQFYKMQDFEDFNSNTIFDKWAAIQVSNLDEIPEGMKSVMIAKGLYAKFIHKGKAEGIKSLLSYIHQSWLPQSEYEIDDRAHFEYMGENYLGPNDPESEEEVWIPIK